MRWLQEWYASHCNGDWEHDSGNLEEILRTFYR
ncbi:Imm53 family immunity protein [Paenibacillus chitinolyticus]|nr:Imm53 family immunity protein [Paenibacillus chitinolyticus]MEC0248182.1 Imm53 family immunity protein [Paenibacillus chitinolyticus]